MTLKNVREQMARERVTTRQQLQNASCAIPGCNHLHESKELYLHGRCHPAAPVSLVALDGRLLAYCSDCGASVALFEIQ